jgi:hypothetical protein
MCGPGRVGQRRPLPRGLVLRGQCVAAHRVPFRFLLWGRSDSDDSVSFFSDIPARICVRLGVHFAIGLAVASLYENRIGFGFVVCIASTTGAT